MVCYFVHAFRDFDWLLLFAAQDSIGFGFSLSGSLKIDLDSYSNYIHTLQFIKLVVLQSLLDIGKTHSACAEP